MQFICKIQIADSIMNYELDKAWIRTMINNQSLLLRANAALIRAKYAASHDKSWPHAHAANNVGAYLFCDVMAVMDDGGGSDRSIYVDPTSRI